MCGLAGYVGSATLDPVHVQRCLRAMRHRGPDAEGSYHHEPAPGRHVYLLHRRLSIIDLDPRANQPFRVGPAVLAANAELFNYLELRDELRHAGREFKTASDTEVMARQLHDHGEAGLDACEGMWAFAFYREDTGELLLCRDRFGEKPLHLYEADGGLYFASEIKFIRLLRGRPLTIDREHVCRYLVNGYKSLFKLPGGFFEQVRPLAPATVVAIDATGRRKERRYWEPSAVQDESMGYEEAVSQVRSALMRSLRLRLRADVPLAFCLSGGVDSNTLAGLARRALGYDVHGFSIYNRDPRYDEREIIGAAVADLGIRHTAVNLETDGFLDNLRRLVVQHDGPISTITYYVQWLLLASIAEQGYRISVSGTGADELFSGYYDHHLAYLYEVRGDSTRHAAALAAWRAHILPAVRNPRLMDPGLFITEPGFRGHLYFDADVFREYLSLPWAEPFCEKRYAPGLLRNRMLNELFHEIVPPILHEDDLNAMSHSVENRSPYLDRHLVELAQRIPTRHLVCDGFAKAVLRDSARGAAPAAVLDQRIKTGFNAPIEDLLDLEDREVRETLLDDGPIYELVNREGIETLISQRSLPNSRSKFLFAFVNAKLFLEEFG
jgi:asparagine synthase (glutamine-hydrolysing)